jgi:23S rRNA pseudouridine2605 synthase
VCVPPRYAYWTILIDDKPTAFRARERDELQPTFAQLQRKNANVVMRWFARGKLWASREAERDDFQLQRQAASAPREPRRDDPAAAERRGTDWRPGGAHQDPRDRFKKKNRPERAWSEKDPATQRDRDKPRYAAGAPRPPRAPREDRPWQQKPPGDQRWSKKPPAAGTWRDKPGTVTEGKRPWTGKPRDKPGTERPWTGKPRDKPGAPSGFPPDPGRARKPWVDRPLPKSDRPWQTKPTGPRAQRQPWIDKPSGDRGWHGKPSAGAPRGDRPWRDKPVSSPRGDRPPNEKRPWSGKPRGDKPGGFKAGGPPRQRQPWGGNGGAGPKGNRPWSGKPGGPSTGGRKRRDDEPPDHD